jgi:hypothetical protein
MSKVFLTVISASLAESATYPLDSLKTRLQLAQGRGSNLAAVLSEMKREGMVRGL